MNSPLLEAERGHLARLLAAIQRCVYFLEASDQKHTWPFTSEYLIAHQKDIALFESLSAINEQFAKLQDTLGAAMRHATLLAGERSDTFLNILAFYEKVGVIDSITEWQVCRTVRNLAAHDYDTDDAKIAEHLNALHTLIPHVYGNAGRFLLYCRDALGVVPVPGDFFDEFTNIKRLHTVSGWKSCPIK
ncbi:MAG: hypothetical protein HQL07_01320 [Nitrospirae bacterium]|nr:hypothetical protein [Magnetococcales bacterium]HAT51492.1 hypothetical protein [Alphaproteobacteria bacterium]